MPLYLFPKFGRTIANIILATISTAPLPANSSVVNPQTHEEHRQEPIRITEAEWKLIGEGIEQARIYAISGSDTLESAMAIRVDSKEYALTPAFDYDAKPISEWHKEIKSPVIINASYWEPDYTPTNHLVMDGELFEGQFPGLQSALYKQFSKKPKGVLVDTPLHGQGELTSIILASEIDYDNISHRSMVESWPMLIENGKTIVEPDNWIANRSVVGTSREGYTILALTEYGDKLTLRETAEFLAQGLSLESALNLDGGIASQMSIKTIHMTCVATGTYEQGHLPKVLRTKPGTEIDIPSIIYLQRRE